MTYLFHTLARLLYHSLWWLALFLICRIAVWQLARPAWFTLPLGLGVGLLWHVLREWAGVASAVRNPKPVGTKPQDAAVNPHILAIMNRSWQAGIRLRRRSVFDWLRSPPARPLFLCFGRDSLAGEQFLAGRRGVRSVCSGELFWHNDTAADWLDLPFAWQRDGREAWNAFLCLLPEKQRRTPISGVVVTLSVASLLRGDETVRRERTELLRRRLNELAETLGQRLPVYVMLDRLDSLYGWRSLAAMTQAKRLAQPLGCFAKDTPSGELVRRSLTEAAAFCRRLPVSGILDKSGFPDSLTAPAMLASVELQRLEAGLAALCGQLFARGGRIAAGGLFFTSSLPGKEREDAGIPPLAAELASFIPAREPQAEEDAWFAEELLRRTLPDNATAEKAKSRTVSNGRRCLWLHAGTAGLLLGTLILCWAMTISFTEARRVLLSAAGKASHPAKADELQPYLELATVTRLRNQGWLLPRFGMNEALDLADELERRYSESYFDLKTIPDLEQVQDSALAAARSGDPIAKGNALLMLLLTRDGICRNLEETGASTGRSEFMQKLAVSLSLANQSDMEQLDAYYGWAGRQEWMPETRDALLAFEKHLLSSTETIEWLPLWLDSLPQLQRFGGADTLGTESAVRPAWTRQGYGVARELLAAAAYEQEQTDEWQQKREALLAAYRRRALTAWTEAANTLWNGFGNRIADEEVKGLLRRAAHRDDPATRFARLACEHLLPMFANEEALSAAAADAAPEIAWLRLWHDMAGPDAATDSRERADKGMLGKLAGQVAGAVRGLRDEDALTRLSGELGLADSAADDPAMRLLRQWEELLPSVGMLAEAPDEFLTAVRRHFQAWEQHGRPLTESGDRLALAGTMADTLTRHLRVQSGSAGWDAVSPTASYDYLRYLAVRQAAVHLDTVWRSSVYAPCLLTPGGGKGRYSRLWSSGGLLETFLTDAAAGFWTWRDENIVSASWDGMAFPFSPEFLAFCNQTRRLGNEPPAKTVQLPLAVRAVSVVGQVREHPVATEFVLTCGETDSAVIHRNYSVKKTLLWTRPETEDLDAVKASIKVKFPSLTASLELSGAEGLRKFAAMLRDGKHALQPEAFGKAAPALRRMGVEEIIIQATMDNVDVLLQELDKRALDLPRSIIRREDPPAAPDFKTIRATVL